MTMCRENGHAWHVKNNGAHPVLPDHGALCICGAVAFDDNMLWSEKKAQAIANGVTMISDGVDWHEVKEEK